MTASTELIDDLRLSWGRLLPLHPMLGEGVITRLCDPRRSFHDARHLRSCLAALDQLDGAERAEYLALWYHNVTTTGTRGRHEQASAAVAATELFGVGLPWVEVGLVARLVLVTADHHPRPEIPGSDRVCDADLAGLAAPFELVEAGFQERRAEMTDLSEPERDAYLRTWIEGMLARDRIFHTAHGYATWEQPARENLISLLALPVFV
ncbi:putative metal-dependent HD superfamily phosphohydrolase [Propionicimonas paludicola]|uniref:Putative metal-dependent HD superfamily phosphohydrolase n=1 Tax=Propionicimonas paludicola TaxID=185243 RepID=A0A2A9CSU5_9ACTN|nr:hypothetical protein [Propionicimonas paludicola]PFG16639.1 putative metal-dependent HD superfamily phosphohydrolase [Propionicimonas paludicola]